jgi:hypothetical protein
MAEVVRADGESTLEQGLLATPEVSSCVASSAPVYLLRWCVGKIYIEFLDARQSVFTEI